MKFRENWVKIRKPVFIVSIPLLWIFYGLLLQPFAPIPSQTFEWGITRLAMAVVAVVFGVLSFKLLDKATR